MTLLDCILHYTCSSQHTATGLVVVVANQLKTCTMSLFAHVLIYIKTTLCRWCTTDGLWLTTLASSWPKCSSGCQTWSRDSISLQLQCTWPTTEVQARVKNVCKLELIQLVDFDRAACEFLARQGNHPGTIKRILSSRLSGNIKMPRGPPDTR